MSLYTVGAKILCSDVDSSLRTKVYKAVEGKNNEKSITNKNKENFIKPNKLYALLASSIELLPHLKSIVYNSQLVKPNCNNKLEIIIYCLLVHDFLLSPKGIAASSQSGNKYVRNVRQNKARINAEYQKLKIKLKVTTLRDISVSEQVRWVRVNTLNPVNHPFWESYTQLSTLPQTMPKCSFYKDIYVQNLYALPSHSLQNILKSKDYAQGKLIIQDRASCFPATILNPNSTQHVIDACAAPGNKTTHLAALMKNGGKITAFEKDPRRANILKKMISKASPQNNQSSDIPSMEIVQADFTQIDPQDYKNVSGILVDPSCSGSGILGRPDVIESENDNNDKNSVERLENLSKFQIKIVSHALKFPNAQKVVYSTCSVHEIENEHVVQKVLESPEAISGGWKLAKRSRVLNDWPRRGNEDTFNGNKEFQQSCVRVLPKIDGGIGFFAALFERTIQTDDEYPEWNGFDD